MATATEIKKSTPQPIDTLKSFLTARREAIAAIAVSGMDTDRIIRIALAACAKTPKLLECKPETVYRAIHQAVQLGLEPGGALQHAYLVPYKGECVLIISYKGLVALARRSGEIATVEARVVFKKDRFDVDFGTDPKILHKPYIGDAPGEILAAYVVITYRSGEKQFDVMSTAQINAIKARSPAAGDGPWVNDWAEMAKKTVVKRGLKMAPLTIEATEAMQREDERDRGESVAPTLSVVAEPDGTDPATGEIPHESAALPEAVQATSRASSETATLRAQREAPAEKRATENAGPTSEDLFLIEIDGAKALTQLSSVGDAIEAARVSLGAGAHKRLITAWQAKFAILNKAGA